MHVPEAWAVHGAHRAAQGSVEDSSGFFQRLHRASGGGGAVQRGLRLPLGVCCSLFACFRAWLRRSKKHSIFPTPACNEVPVYGRRRWGLRLRSRGATFSLLTAGTPPAVSQGFASSDGVALRTPSLINSNPTPSMSVTNELLPVDPKPNALHSDPKPRPRSLSAAKGRS